MVLLRLGEYISKFRWSTGLHWIFLSAFVRPHISEVMSSSLWYFPSFLHVCGHVCSFMHDFQASRRKLIFSSSYFSFFLFISLSSSLCILSICYSSASWVLLLIAGTHLHAKLASSFLLSSWTVGMYHHTFLSSYYFFFSMVSCGRGWAWTYVAEEDLP